MPCKSHSRAFYHYLDNVTDPDDLHLALNKVLQCERQLALVGRARHPQQQAKAILFALTRSRTAFTPDGYLALVGKIAEALEVPTSSWDLNEIRVALFHLQRLD
ncbi:hypothetical protein TWF696_003750 [Orbilia brochopaga]|uniref:Uncharacterized protein n=1 Tax=Orbilia brochopaga TaxID=3140254 RepID=A0AAV9V5Q9_9PEZI